MLTLLYAAETWTFTKTLGCKIRSTQIKMERKMLEVTWREKVTNNTIKEKTKLPDTLQMLVIKMKVDCSQSYR